MSTEHLVARVPEAVHRLIGELLGAGLVVGVQGAESFSASRSTTLHQNDGTIRADLTITLDLNVFEIKKP